MSAQLTPLGAKLYLVEPVERTADGIVLAGRRLSGDPQLVVAKGPLVKDISVGDRVLLQGRPGVVVTVDGAPVRLANACDVIAVISQVESDSIPAPQGPKNMAKAKPAAKPAMKKSAPKKAPVAGAGGTPSMMNPAMATAAAKGGKCGTSGAAKGGKCKK